MPAFPAPIRFVLLLVAGWTMFRLAVWAPFWTGGEEAPPLVAGRPPAEALPHAEGPWRFADRDAAIAPGAVAGRRSIFGAAQAPSSYRADASTASPSPLPGSMAPWFPSGQAPLPPREPAPPWTAPTHLPAEPPPARRFAGSAWLLARGGADGLAPGGQLGGSQAGMRLTYALGGGLAASGRVHAPLDRPAGAEAAVGLEWRPDPAIPAALLVERRIAIGADGRSAFSATLFGGVSDRAVAGALRLDAYAQAGLVGLRTRDAFVDGSATLTVPAGPVAVGGGLWGAAQPGAARLDAGPRITARLPVPGNVRASADWRFRVAGDAAPSSGPALTIGMDF